MIVAQHVRKQGQLDRFQEVGQMSAHPPRLPAGRDVRGRQSWASSRLSRCKKDHEIFALGLTMTCSEMVTPWIFRQQRE
jgi:hypothetical protein